MTPIGPLLLQRDDNQTHPPAETQCLSADRASWSVEGPVILVKIVENTLNNAYNLLQNLRHV